MIQIWEVDENKFFTGESCFVEEVLENHVTEPLLVGYVKAFWNGEAWVEGATESEIEDWKNNQPTHEPEISEQDKRIGELEEELLTSNLYMTDMELKMIELEMKLEALLAQ